MKENISSKKQRVCDIIEIFDKVYSDADYTLEYENGLQLLISTQLAAQCTDARVNIVAKIKDLELSLTYFIILLAPEFCISFCNLSGVALEFNFAVFN